MQCTETFILETAVLGGLPVTVEFQYCSPDPDAGMLRSYIEEWDIVAVGNRACKQTPQWLLNRMTKVKGEIDHLMDQCFELVEIN